MTKQDFLDGKEFNYRDVNYRYTETNIKPCLISDNIYACDIEYVAALEFGWELCILNIEIKGAVDFNDCLV